LLPEHHAPLGLRTVAIFEFAKGLIVLIAGLGLLSLIHKDVQKAAEQIVFDLGLNPAHHYPRIFIDAASTLTDQRLWLLSLAALFYAIIRFVETYGLWHEKAWAEWFAAISAALYLPIELIHVIEKPTWVSAVVPLINVGIVAYLIYLIHESSKKPEARPAP
jgi:uncharacterized membrane protein (DUF2068 family)